MPSTINDLFYSDFGASSWIETMGLSQERARHTFIGTVSFMAPEVIEQDQGYDFKADIWNFGITVLELITGAAPFHKLPPLKVLMMTLQNDPPSLESVSEFEDQYKGYGKSVRKLIVDCLQKDPAKRPTASELLKHPFMKKAKDRRYLLQTLLPNTPSLNERSRRALDAHRASGFELTNNGELGSWVWPADEGILQQSNGCVVSAAVSTCPNGLDICVPSQATAIENNMNNSINNKNNNSHGGSSSSSQSSSSETSSNTSDTNISSPATGYSVPMKESSSTRNFHNHIFNNSNNNHHHSDQRWHTKRLSEPGFCASTTSITSFPRRDPTLSD